MAFKSSRAEALQKTVSPIMRFASESKWAQKDPQEECSDFTFGNPHEMPLKDYVEVLKNVSEPKNKDWFAYKQNVEEAQVLISESLSSELSCTFNAEDICMTNGAIAALDVTIKTITEPGDEIIFFTPHWFLYEGMIQDAGAKAVKIPLLEESFDLDLEAIQNAINPKTRAIIVNSPHNPSGKVFSREILKNLAGLIKQASLMIERDIYIISDEAYRKITFDECQFISPATVYNNTFVIYTYGKIHLTPGQRIGYIALPECMDDREDIRQAIGTVQMFSGWAYPNAILQYGIKHFEHLTIDVDSIERRRDLFIKELSEIGYETNRPQSTFYLLVKSPMEDDWAFVEKLADYKVYCLPGVTFGLPGYFRISLTANDEMLERSIQGFRDTYS